MSSRFVHLSGYASRIIDSGYAVLGYDIHRASVRCTSEDTGIILRIMLVCELFRREYLNHEAIWAIYAEAQKEKYLQRGISSNMIRGIAQEDFTRCYICACLVGRRLHAKFDHGKWDRDTPPGGVHHWNISHIIADSKSKCGENFNIRICCRKCNVYTNTKTPFEFSKEIRREGLAFHEKITSLEGAFNVYFQNYRGRDYGL